jgi:hypothetical protein
MPPRFHHLQRSHIFKNAFCVVLEACITDMHQGRAVHTLSLKTVFDQDSYVESSVIDINLLQVWQHRRSKESIQEFIYAQLGCLECHDDGICPAWFLSRIFFISLTRCLNLEENLMGQLILVFLVMLPWKARERGMLLLKTLCSNFMELSHI